MSSIYRIANHSGQGPVSCFVSKYSGGSDDWFTLALDYSNHTASDWTRGSGAWESVVFKDQSGKRRGFYLFCPGSMILEITFYGMERDIGLRYLNAATGLVESGPVPC